MVVYFFAAQTVAIFKSENNETTVAYCGLPYSKGQHRIAYAARLEQRRKDNLDLTRPYQAVTATV